MILGITLLCEVITQLDSTKTLQVFLNLSEGSKKSRTSGPFVITVEIVWNRSK